jgi:hypothetical protein
MKSCTCGHGKNIHHRDGANHTIAPPNPCNFPACKCPNYMPERLDTKL